MSASSTDAASSFGTRLRTLSFGAAGAAWDLQQCCPQVEVGVEHGTPGLATERVATPAGVS